MHIVTRGGIDRMATIRRLRFPFPTTIEAIEGNVWYTTSGHTRLLRQHQRVCVLPLALCDIGLTNNGIVLIQSAPDSICGNSGINVSSDEQNLTNQVIQLPPTAMSLARTLALNVFRSPHFEWTQDLFSSIVALSRSEISRKLFVQGESFRQIVHAQRLIRFLFDLHDIPYVDDNVARQYGFAHSGRLEGAVYDKFDLTLDRLKHLFSRWPFPESELGLIRSTLPYASGAIDWDR